MAAKKVKVNPFKSWTLTEFQLSIAAFKETYPREMLVDFHDHYMEPDEFGVMKFQNFDTWSTGGRLRTWARKNYLKYDLTRKDSKPFSDPNVPAKNTAGNRTDVRREANSESRKILGLQ